MPLLLFYSLCHEVAGVSHYCLKKIHRCKTREIKVVPGWLDVKQEEATTTFRHLQEVALADTVIFVDQERCSDIWISLFMKKEQLSAVKSRFCSLVLFEISSRIFVGLQFVDLILIRGLDPA